MLEIVVYCSQISLLIKVNCW